MHAQMIIFRKFGIAFVSLFFKNCPSQQLSICLLLLFGCYVCQVANNPYMSPQEYERVLEDFKDKSDAKGSTTWRKIADKVKTRMVRHEKRKKRRAVKSFDKDNSIAKKGADVATAFLWNYNSVEGILLSCAVFINLSGIMFQAFADCGRDIPGVRCIYSCVNRFFSSALACAA